MLKKVKKLKNLQLNKIDQLLLSKGITENPVASGINYFKFTIERYHRSLYKFLLNNIFEFGLIKIKTIYIMNLTGI